MANHAHNGTDMHQYLDSLNWPVIGISATMWPFFAELWEHLPGPTAVYMVVSAAFMLFQMSDKLGMLERFKRTRPESSK